MVTKTKIHYIDSLVYDLNYSSYEGSPPPPAPSVSGSIFELEDTVEHEGSVPNFKRRIAEVTDATSFLTGTKRTYWVRSGNVSESIQYPKDPHPSVLTVVSHVSRTGDICGLSHPHNVGTPTLETAENQAIMRFISNSRSAQTALYGGVVLGEIRETLNMLRNPAKALRSRLDDFLSTAKKRRKGTSAHKRRVLSETWLEYSFGMIPLVSDIKGAATALYRIYTSAVPHKAVKGFGEDKAVVDSSSGGSIGNVSWTTEVRNEESYVVIYRGAVSIDTDSKATMSKQNLGFRLDDFVPTLWELIPYSFLVDYFTNIGDILSSWSYFESNFRWKSRTELHKLLETKNMVRPVYPFQFNFDPFALILSANCQPGSSSAELKTVTRARHVGPLIPTFRMEIPGMNSLKWLNLAALGRTHSRLLPF